MQPPQRDITAGRPGKRNLPGGTRIPKRTPCPGIPVPLMVIPVIGKRWISVAMTVKVWTMVRSISSERNVSGSLPGLRPAPPAPGIPESSFRTSLQDTRESAHPLDNLAIPVCFRAGKKPGSIWAPAKNPVPYSNPVTCAPMKLPDRFPRYFLIAAILLLSGIALVIVQAAVQNPHPEPLDHAGLQARADFHRVTVMPFMAHAFPRLLFLNAGVALFILIVPLFWVWVWWFLRDQLLTVTAFMRGTAGILMIALGHNSFTKIYVTYRILPWPMIAVMYLPHGWLEMLAFVLAGTFSFLLIDALQTYLKGNRNNDALHPGEICLFILGRAAKPAVAVFALVAIAAAIECWVTPGLIEAAYEAALQTMQ